MSVGDEAVARTRTGFSERAVVGLAGTASPTTIRPSLPASVG